MNFGDTISQSVVTVIVLASLLPINIQAVSRLGCCCFGLLRFCSAMIMNNPVTITVQLSRGFDAVGQRSGGGSLGRVE